MFYHYLVKIEVGHSVTISGGGLQVTYNVDQFHFHWGGNSSLGSEHTIDSRHYPLEVKKKKDDYGKVHFNQTLHYCLKDISFKLSNVLYCVKIFRNVFLYDGT